MSNFLAIIFLTGASISATFLLRRVSRQWKDVYRLQREGLDTRLTDQVVEGMDEETRREYLKKAGQ